MAIDILTIEPSVIDRSLSGKTVLLAGSPKIGKSEFCAQSPQTLIIDLENGYNAHPGVTAVQVTRWAEVKRILKQLEKPEAKEKYKNVAIDTLSEFWELCTTFICNQAGVQKIGDIPYGGGYKARDEEFAKVLRKIIMLNYGLILTCHIRERVIGTENDIDIISLAPDLEKRCLPIVNGLVDIIGVIYQTWNDEGQSERWLITKATPTITAGSRWPNLAPKIPFGYDNLEKAIANAINEAEKQGAKVVDYVEKESAEELDYTAIRNEAYELWTQLIEKDPANAEIIAKKVEMIFGRKLKLSEITEDQVSLFELVLSEMKELV